MQKTYIKINSVPSDRFKQGTISLCEFNEGFVFLYPGRMAVKETKTQTDQGSRDGKTIMQLHHSGEMLLTKTTHPLFRKVKNVSHPLFRKVKKINISNNFCCSHAVILKVTGAYKQKTHWRMESLGRNIY